MKQLRRWIYLGPLSAGILFAEYEVLQRLGGVFVVFAGACALAIVAGALYRAPEGYEGADGFHIRPRKRSSGFGSAVRPSQRQMRRGWT
jgi:hypothetical protein